MSGFLAGLAGGACMTLLLLLAVVFLVKLAGPALVRKAMQQQARQMFGNSAAGAGSLQSSGRPNARP